VKAGGVFTRVVIVHKAASVDTNPFHNSVSFSNPEDKERNGSAWRFLNGTNSDVTSLFVIQEIGEICPVALAFRFQRSHQLIQLWLGRTPPSLSAKVTRKKRCDLELKRLTRTY